MDDDGRVVCLNCGHVHRDDPSTVERLLSNVTPEHESNSGVRASGDVAARLARVLGGRR
jgi:hypothetical protein